MIYRRIYIPRRAPAVGQIRTVVSILHCGRRRELLFSTMLQRPGFVLEVERPGKEADNFTQGFHAGIGAEFSPLSRNSYYVVRKLHNISYGMNIVVI